MGRLYEHIIISGKKSLAVILIVASVLFATGYIPLFSRAGVFPKTTKIARASYQFDPSGGGLVTGTAAPILGLTAPTAEGVNMGDWKGTVADDNLHWGFSSTASGYNAYLDLGNVVLNGANKLIFETELDLDATAPATLVQVCDWVSSVGVNGAADAQCTGGGWRNLNLNDATIAPTTGTAYDWQVYNGYWGASATSSINTPLTNFVNGSNTIRVRYYSTTNTTSLVNIDYLRVFAVVNPVYSASGATQLSGGTIVGDYAMANIGGAGQLGSDNAYFQVPGTAGSVSDFYLSYKNVKTYTGANTILVRAEYSCSATGPTRRPKIYNFATELWEDLTTASIACATADATNAWAKSNININDYISGGEIRVGWYGLSNSTVSLRLDMQYIMIGTVNTGEGAAVTFGSSAAGSVSDTASLDMTGTASTWSILGAAKSNTQAFASYAYDGNNNTTAGYAAAANVNFNTTIPEGGAITGVFFASRHMSGTAGTVQVGVMDYGAGTSVTGGWSAVGAVGTTALVYTDNISVATVASGGATGWSTSPKDFTDSVTNMMNMRLRTSVSAASVNTAQWDFAMMSIQWIEQPIHPSESYRYGVSGGGIVTGTAPAILGLTAPATEGVNMGDWRGAIADDNLHFGVTSSASGYNAYLDIGDVRLNGANKIILQTEFDLDATAPSTLVQVCDWVSSVGVNSAADAQCTGGGWRNLNLNDAAITTVTATAYDWEIYDGYWSSSATTSIATPLANFINGSNTIRVRYYSTTNTTSLVNIDYLRAFVVVNPVYSGSSATQISGGTITGDYSMANMGGAGQTGADTAYFQVPGTASTVSDFYVSYKNVKTYPGANTILYRANYSCSATGPTIRPKIYNYNTTLWEDLTTTSIACSTTAATNAWSKSNITMSNYISNGEIRVGWHGLSNSTVAIRLNMAYVMIGTTNTDGVGNITFGSNAAGTVANTSDLDMTGTSNTWNLLGAAKSNTQAFATYGYDSNNNTTAGYAVAANVDFGASLPNNTAAAGIFFASRHMSGTVGTVIAGIRDFGGSTNVTGGWSPVGAGATTALIYTDNISMATVASGGAAGWSTSVGDHLDTVGAILNMRLRTSASGASAMTAQWDFAMMSFQWIEVPPVSQSLTFSISNNTAGFGSLNASGERFATADGLGSTTEAVAHTITAATNSSNGYVLSINGNTLSAGSSTIAAIGAVNTASIPGTEQFGMRMTATGGMGVVSAPYDGAGYAFNTTAFPDAVAMVSSGSTPTTYAVRYLGNISTQSQAGAYAANVTYTITASF
ncbi:MAG TPA: hypothetical protein VJ579_02780 [Candidatus Paceibacterota bacterium]|nr:hypothetical protein [Candidatus Paceibacterota bacterium]